MASKVLDFLDDMKIKPNEFTYSVLFKACAAVGNERAMKIGKMLLHRMPESYRNDYVTATSAVNMLMKLGDVESGERLFRSIKGKNIIAYNAMMKGNRKKTTNFSQRCSLKQDMSQMQCSKKLWIYSNRSSFR